jgi:hypothetical protein
VSDVHATPGDSGKEAARIRRVAEAWDFMRRAVDGETPECDRNTAEWMVGFILGQHAGQLRQAYKGRMTQEQAAARARQWVRDRAALAAMEVAEAEDEGNADAL